MDLKPVMKTTELEDYIYQVFPELHRDETRPYTIDRIAPGEADVTFKPMASDQRPGGTLAGPVMMALADLALYVVILSHIGPVPLAVTTSLNFNFLRKPPIADLTATASLLKLGKRLAIGSVDIRSKGSANLVTHATGTYSIPQQT
jgi:uncharacterized protein (TIGR00369 family)